MCPTNDGIEEMEHYWLLYPPFKAPNRDVSLAFLNKTDRFD